jgi:hypothetical protein
MLNKSNGELDVKIILLASASCILLGLLLFSGLSEAALSEDNSAYPIINYRWRSPNS